MCKQLSNEALLCTGHWYSLHGLENSCRCQPCSLHHRMAHHLSLLPSPAAPLIHLRSNNFVNMTAFIHWSSAASKAQVAILWSRKSHKLSIGPCSAFSNTRFSHQFLMGINCKGNRECIFQTRKIHRSFSCNTTSPALPQTSARPPKTYGGTWGWNAVASAGTQRDWDQLLTPSNTSSLCVTAPGQNNSKAQSRTLISGRKQISKYAHFYTFNSIHYTWEVAAATTEHCCVWVVVTSPWFTALPANEEPYNAPIVRQHKAETCSRLSQTETPTLCSLPGAHTVGHTHCLRGATAALVVSNHSNTATRFWPPFSIWVNKVQKCN